MTIKKEMEGKEEYNYADDIVETKPEVKPKKQDNEYEILKLKKCIKEKDKRIKKIEEYFWVRNRVILSVLASLFCFSPFILMFIFCKPVPIEYETPLILLIFALIGVVASISFILYSLMWLLEKIWSE